MHISSRANEKKHLDIFSLVSNDVGPVIELCGTPVDRKLKWSWWNHDVASSRWHLLGTFTENIILSVDITCLNLIFFFNSHFSCSNYGPCLSGVWTQKRLRYFLCKPLWFCIALRPHTHCKLNTVHHFCLLSLVNDSNLDTFCQFCGFLWCCRSRNQCFGPGHLSARSYVHCKNNICVQGTISYKHLLSPWSAKWSLFPVCFSTQRSVWLHVGQPVEPHLTERYLRDKCISFPSELSCSNMTETHSTFHPELLPIL